MSKMVMHANIDKIIEDLTNRRIGGHNDVNSIRNGYNHIAAVITKNKRDNFNVESIGENSMNNNISIHAESCAINKLPSNNKNFKKVDILVIRVSPSRKLGNSKPCIKCIDCMCNFAVKKGYKINNIYYSTTCGEIQKKKLIELINDDDIHISKYYRLTNYKHPLLNVEC